MKSMALILVVVGKVLHRVWMGLGRTLFKSCGKNVVFGRGCEFSFANIVIGDDVFIGAGANFSTIKTIKIGSKVMFGPNVTIMGGDHRTDVVGSCMYDVHEKLTANDRDVVIEDDVWIGANAVILKGVVIGRGSIVGAGSVVVKSIPPYSIYLGAPPMKLLRRWDSEKIAEHERLLGLRGSGG